MNTLKFESAFHEREETHSADVYKIENCTIDGMEHKYYNNLSMSIVLSNHCNATCFFCSNPSKIKDICNDDEYISRLACTLDKVRNLNPAVILTGGEPTLSPRLRAVLKLLNEKGFLIRTFATNGFGLDTDLLKDMLKFGAIHNINISLAHFEQEINKKIMGCRSITHQELESIATFCDINNMDTRLSCLLIKEGISDFSSILDYLQFSKSIGFKSVIFRELIGGKDSFVNLEDIINKYVKGNNQFHFVRRISGFQYDIDVYRYKDYVVKHYSDKAISKTVDPSVIRNLIIQPDCNVYTRFASREVDKLIRTNNDERF